MGKYLVILGLLMILLGLFIQNFKFWQNFKLPGDLHWRFGGFSFYFPVTTCLVGSLLISAVFWIIKKIQE